MRGHLSYYEVMNVLSKDDISILQDIIKENIKNTTETKISMV
jgi:hypothetical protein